MRRLTSCFLRRWSHFGLWVAAQSLGPVIAYAPAADAELTNARQVLAAWKRREEGARNLRFEWSQDDILAAGSLTRPLPGEMPQPRAGEPVPSSDVTLSNRFVYISDGRNLRYHQLGDIWSPNQNRASFQDYTAAFVGSESRALFARNVGSYPIGEIGNGVPDTGLCRNTNTLALRLVYRSFDPTQSPFRASNLKLQNGTAVVAKVPCTIAYCEESPFVKSVVWLDPSRDFIPLRYIVEEEGHVALDMVVHYSQSADGAWPSTWVWSEFDPGGKVVSSHSATVTSCGLNARIPTADFEIEFPPGTWVFDKTNKSQYVVLPNGSHRFINPGEGSKDYERIVRGANWSRALGWAFFGCVAISLLLLLRAKLRISWLVRDS